MVEDQFNASAFARTTEHPFPHDHRSEAVKELIPAELVLGTGARRRLYGHGSESYDARLEQPGRISAGFNDSY